jgi:hypothetical protein
MRKDPLPHIVRGIVARTFESLGEGLLGPWDIEESVLLDEGRYPARTYRIDGFMAMWLVEVGVLQFYDMDGAMVLTINLLEELAPNPMAAAA